jgi:hypothetical protein
MLKGIGLACSALPLQFIEEHGLERRVHERGGEREVRFLWTDEERVLPVWMPDGHLRLMRWGNRREESKRLPCTAGAALKTFEEGGWTAFNPTTVDIPATVCLDGQVWFAVRQGIRGILTEDEQGIQRVFLLYEDSSFYYLIMVGQRDAKAKVMPGFIGERF